jgi:hypothetical protein
MGGLGGLSGGGGSVLRGPQFPSLPGSGGRRSDFRLY